MALDKAKMINIKIALQQCYIISIFTSILDCGLGFDPRWHIFVWDMVITVAAFLRVLADLTLGTPVSIRF